MIDVLDAAAVAASVVGAGGIGLADDAEARVDGAESNGIDFPQSVLGKEPTGAHRVMVSALFCCGIVICSMRPLIILGRRYRLPD